MGRLIHRVRIESARDEQEFMELDALVDTGASIVTLPMKYKKNFEHLSFEDAQCVTASEITKALIGGPVKVSLSGFRPVFSEVAFLEGLDEPLIGYTVLGSIPVAVDMLGHRLVPVQYLDMK